MPLGTTLLRTNPSARVSYRIILDESLLDKLGRQLIVPSRRSSHFSIRMAIRRIIRSDTIRPVRIKHRLDSRVHDRFTSSPKVH